MYVIKASGKRVKFDKNRVRRTCMRAGADTNLADAVLREVSNKVYDGMPTRDILRLTLACLKKENPVVATRYRLKKAVLELGPGGFVFEKFVRQLLRIGGYDAWFPKIIRGVCVDHEVDIIAKSPRADEPFPWKVPRNKSIYMIECKYHNAAGVRTGIKIALYVWARFLDLRDGCKKGYCEKFDYPWLISNTKFSRSAKAYAECKNMRLLGWRYPSKAGLEYLIESNKAYPITILRGLDLNSRERLFSQDIILCTDLLDLQKQKAREKAGIKQQKLNNLIKQAQLIT